MTVETPPFSLQAAEAFVMREGDPRRKATWKAVFGWGPVEVLIFELEPHIDEAGRWSGFGPGGELGAAIASLRFLTALNLGEDIFEVGQRTAARLLALRAADGSWDEDAAWPGSGGGDPRRAWFTAALGMLLPRLTGSADDAATVACGGAAAAWLVAHPAAVAAAGPATWWTALACVGGAQVKGASAMAEDLASKLNAWATGARPASDLAWMHEAARLAGRPADALRQRVWAQLAAGQQPDGGWDAGSDAGLPADRVDATIVATRAVVRP